MVSKFLIGLFAVAVMGVGGYAYYKHTTNDCCMPSADSPGACPLAQTAETPSCCQQPSRISTSAEAPCCSTPAESSLVSSEILTIEPREVK